MFTLKHQNKKDMKKLGLIFGLAGLSVFNVSAQDDCLKGMADPIKEKRVVGIVHSVEVNDDIDVYLVNSAKDFIQVSAQFNILPVIEAVNENGVLKLGVKEGTCFNSVKDMTVYVYSSDFKAITLNGSGDIYTKTNLRGDKLDIKVNGSGDVDLTDIALKALDISIIGSGDVIMTGVDTIEAVNLNVTGSGDINIVDAPSAEVIAEIGGSGDIKITATTHVTATIKGSGSVHIKGGAEVEQYVDGSGKVDKIK